MIVRPSAVFSRQSVSANAHGGKKQRTRGTELSSPAWLRLAAEPSGEAVRATP